LLDRSTLFDFGCVRIGITAVARPSLLHLQHDHAKTQAGQSALIDESVILTDWSRSQRSEIHDDPTYDAHSAAKEEEHAFVALLGSSAARS